MGSLEVAAFFHFRLFQPASSGRRLKQPGVVTQIWEGEGKMQPDQPGATLHGGSFCAAWRKLWERRQVLALFGCGLNHTLGGSVTFLVG